MCDLFIPCVTENRKINLKQALKTQEKKKKIYKKKKMDAVTDTPSFIMKYCIIIKARVKLATEPTPFMHFWGLL